jgi:hypothetical protein
MLFKSLFKETFAFCLFGVKQQMVSLLVALGTSRSRQIKFSSATLHLNTKPCIQEYIKELALFSYYDNPQVSHLLVS